MWLILTLWLRGPLRPFPPEAAPWVRGALHTNLSHFSRHVEADTARNLSIQIF